MKNKIIILAKSLLSTTKTYMKGFSLVGGFKYKITHNQVQAEQVSEEMGNRLIEEFRIEGRYKHAQLEDVSIKDRVDVRAEIKKDKK